MRIRIARVVALLVVVIGAAPVEARPLPTGMKVFSKDQTLFVTRDGLTLPLVDPDVQARNTFGDVKGVELSADGTQLLVQVERCSAAEEPFAVPLVAVEARFENARGMAAHVKKQYADAIAHFTIAARKDPDHPVYATNLVSAQSMAKQLDDADRTLAAYGAKHVAWFAWRLAVDPELANVAGRAAAKALVAARPGKLRYRGLADAIAVSPLGLVAVREWTFFGGPGAPSGEDLAIYDAAGVQPVLRLPVVALDDACFEPDPKAAADDQAMMMGPPCTKQQRARTAVHTRDADRLLAILGFEPRAIVWVKADDAGAKLGSPDGKTKVVFAGGTDDRTTVVVTRGKATATAAVEASPREIGFAGEVVVFRYKESMFAGCSGDAQRSYSQAVIAK